MSYTELDKKFFELENRVRELEKLNGHLARQAREYYLLYDATRQLFQCTDKKDFFEKLGSLFKSSFNVDELGFIVYNERGNILTVPYSLGLPRSKMKEIFFKIGNSLVGKVFTEQTCVYLPNIAEVKNYTYYFETKKANGAVFYLPLQSTAGQKIGVIKLRKYAIGGFTESEKTVLQRLRTEIADAWHRLNLDEAQDVRYYKNPQTGLFNRNFFLEIFPAEFKRAQRYHRQFSLISVYLSPAKHNPELMNMMVDSLKSILRKSDLLIHYDAEKLFFLLPETNRNAVLEVSRKISALLSPYKEKLRKAPVIKTCTYPDDTIEPDQLLSLI